MRRVLVVIVAACALLAGCKVETSATVTVRDDGSGSVRVKVALDADAVGNAEAGGGKLEDRVRIGDLPGAGWSVSGWRRATDGSATLALSKRFARPSDLAGIFAELNGKNGPVRGVTLTRDQGLFLTRYRVTGVADLSALNSGIADDPELVARLTGQKVDLTQLGQRLTQELRDSFRLRIVVQFPGAVTRTFAPEPGKKVDLTSSVSPLGTRRVVLLAIAVVLGLLAIVVLLRGGVRGRGRRHADARRRASG